MKKTALEMATFVISNYNDNELRMLNSAIVDQLRVNQNMK